MYNEDLLLNKAGSGVSLTLAELCGLSAAEIKSRYEGELSWGESQYLSQQAAETEKENRMLEARIFSRSNPQLASAVRLGIRQASESRSYDSHLGSRASAFVSSDSVASMFSPAAYLTVLYREAQDLHFPSSSYHLSTRRPDLAGLSLSQRNMDEEVSTLTLANEVLAEHISRQQDITPEDLLKTLATHRQTGQTPYHQPYETVRQVIQNKQPDLSVLSRNPDVAGDDNKYFLQSMLANISPELKEILAEDVTEENSSELYENNFKYNSEELNTPQAIAEYYEIPHKQLANFIGNNDDFFISEDELPGISGSVYSKGSYTRSVFRDDGALEKINISILDSQWLSGLHYLEIIPLGDLRFSVRFSVIQTYPQHTDFSIRDHLNRILFKEVGFIPQAGMHYSRDITIVSSESLTLRLNRDRPGENIGLTSLITFSIKRTTREGFLLKLNKAIRLCRATGLSPSQLETLVLSNNNEGLINHSVLAILFSGLFYQTRYGVGLDDALVLSGATISTHVADGEVSHFNRIFNSPPLGRYQFSPGDEPLVIQPGNGEDNAATAALKRGLDVNSAELLSLYQLVDSSSTESIPGDIISISHLWRLRLLARVHDLTVTELHLLYQQSPVQGENANVLSISQWHALAEFLYQARQLMTDMSLSPAELFLLSTRQSGTSLIPEMRTLLSSLHTRLTSVELDMQGREELANLLAPFIAATLSLSSPDMGRYVLLWTEILRPDVLKIKEFAELAARESMSPEDTVKVARFCHALAQTGLLVQKLRLSEAEVAALVNSGKRLVGGGLSTPRMNILRSLQAFHQWLNGLGTRSSEMLDALEQGTLTPDVLASVMDTEPLMITQAMTCADVADLKSWQNIYLTLQWKNVSNALNVMPGTIQQLLSLQYVSLPERNSDETWQLWQSLSRAMEAAVEGRTARALESLTAEHYSTALNAWFRTYCQPQGVRLRNRDELYSYLLIDNQVSAQVQTSRLAEAIASLQLYINRAVNRMEDGTQTDVISRQFFLDWSLYSRYSNWSGVSMLAYYPENYIDPTLRIGQTRMMDELLENISQGKLSQDAVEDAFKTYLTRFETVADLTVVNAYHDNVNSDSGTTWLLGRSKENINEYHWRTVDISKLQHGTLPANAWGEWTRIDMPLIAWKDMVRPVVFRDRLYIIWVEREEMAVTEDNGQVKNLGRFILKLAFRRHDDSWSAPWNYDITTQIDNILQSGTDHEPALSAVGFSGEDTLLVFMYRTAENYAVFGERNDSVTGLAVYGDGTFSPLSASQLVRFSEISNTFDVISPSTMARSKKASYRFSIDYEAPSTLTLFENSSDMIRISRAMLEDITIQSSLDNVIINVKKSSIAINPMLQGIHGRSIMEAITISGASDNYVIFSEQFPTNAGFSRPGPYLAYNIKDGIAGGRLYLTHPVSGDVEFLDASGTVIATTPFRIYHGTTELKFNISESVFRTIRSSRVSTGTPWNNPQLMTYHTPVNTDALFNPAHIRMNIGDNHFEPSSLIEGNNEAIFTRIQADISSLFINSSSVSVDVLATNQDNSLMGRGVLRVNKVDLSPENILQIKSTESGAQYMQLGVHRVRLNTLLGPELVSRAATGIDAILSMETQNLPEPQLGKGFYATFTLPAYNADVHGSKRNFCLKLKHVVDNNVHVIYSGQFQDHELTVRLFIPLDASPLQSNFVAKVFLTTQHNPDDGSWNGPHFIENNGVIDIHPQSNISMFNNVSILSDTTEPMDFNGACALYFWELFYYTPMMVFQRLLQEQNFSEATRWLHYVWNPAGYIVQGHLQNYLWNVRPLEEETSWNASPLNSVDPDAVAQADPMHYKVATFMRMLDLLIARGDSAYRQLERDTLNEAKMWYVQALALLGDEPDLTFSTHWGEPTLAKAADKTLKRNYQQLLARINDGEALLPEMRTANSLTGLFLPEFNEALGDYWKILRQRLFNLRNHLTIDGMPLSLPVFADRADPSQLLSSMVLSAQESSHLPVSTLTLWRFPVMLERARNTVGQLTQFGTTLLSLVEHQDADELKTLLMQQGMELVTQSIRLQERVVDEVAADREVILQARRGVQERLAIYQRLWDENISRPEQSVMNMQTNAGSVSLGAEAFLFAASIADIVPNIYGLAVGGSRWGAPLQAAADGISIGANATLIAAERMSLSESYRRRREEWEIQRDEADSELRQLDAQLRAIEIRQEAARLQVDYLQTQQEQTLAQMEFLQRKFTNQALYNWMRGKLSAIYYQFFDLSQSMCLMAQEALRREINDPAATYIRGGAWNGSSAGFMAGETLLLNLTEMEKVWLERDARAFEVTRTVSLAQVYRELDTDGFELADKLAAMLNSGSGSSGVTNTELKFSADGQLQASVQLAKLAISDDYPAGLGKHRQIKQVSVTLPALVGPYEDVRAVLNYGGSMAMPKGCNAIAVSHGLNDSGQFFLDFNDARYLPFEGIPVDDSGSLTLSFPDATGRQKALLQSLNDIILHIRYTIQA